jgi:hypothetical protein
LNPANAHLKNTSSDLNASSIEEPESSDVPRVDVAETRILGVSSLSPSRPIDGISTYTEVMHEKYEDTDNFSCHGI